MNNYEVFDDEVKFLNTTVDLYSKKLNTIIEFYGDYWHCNPKIYDKNYYHKRLKMHAYEKWIKDKNRINLIHEKFPDTKIIIVWENSFNKLGEEIILNKIKDLINKEKEKILWI